mmetsp:Transcript_20375/g.26270  ORF Transcript_20375/g.26270 Transcript_20375/m.26270 type:complete len:217 (+) Transcript_20375:187-837(+)
MLASPATLPCRGKKGLFFLVLLVALATMSVSEGTKVAQNRGVNRKTDNARDKNYRVCPYDEPTCNTFSQGPSSLDMGTICTDRMAHCDQYPTKNATRVVCISDFQSMKNDCPDKCNVCPKYFSSFLYNEVIQRTNFPNFHEFMKEQQRYMFQRVYVKGKKYPQDVALNCLNRHAECSKWASAGECELNPAYMKVQCAPACKSCLYESSNLQPSDLS